MAKNDNDKNLTGKDSNPDPITGAPGAHPVGTGIGAAAGGAATGAAIGSFAGPLGTAAGVVVGAVVGGLMGKYAAEAVDPTNEEEFWKENYKREPYVTEDATYDTYSDAYRTGYEGYATHGSKALRFEEVEPTLRQSYEQKRKASAPEWDKARLAAKAAWERVSSSTNLERLIGYEVIDQNGEATGKVENLWADHYGKPAYLGISTEETRQRTLVVPAKRVEVSHNSRRIRLPFLGTKLSGAPKYESDASFTESMEQEINRYYGFEPSSAQQHTKPSTPPTPSTGQQTVQLKEETMNVGKREVDAGGVRLRKVVRTETVNKPVELRREELVVERVPISGAAAQTGDKGFEGEEIYVPLLQEEAVVQKNTVVREEVRVGKKTSSEQQNVSGTIRKEDVEISHEGNRASNWVDHDNYWRQNYLKSSSYQQGKSYEDYQGAYRTGYEGYSRYKGQRFEDVESNLRTDYERNRGSSSLTWENVKGSVRDAWHRIERALPGDADGDGR